MDFHDEDVFNIIYPATLLYDLDESELEDAGAIITFNQWLSEQDLFTDSDLDLSDVNSYVEVFTDYNIYGNREHWAESSGIPKRADGYGEYDGGCYKLYNCGDFEMPFKLMFSIDSTPQTFNIRCGNRELTLTNVTAKGDDKFIVIDTAALMIQGYNENKTKTKNLYNENITKGELFNLPIGEIQLFSNIKGNLDFNYLYL